MQREQRGDIACLAGFAWCRSRTALRVWPWAEGQLTSVASSGLGPSL